MSPVMGEKLPSEHIAAATVVRVSGSAPRPVGSKLFVFADGTMRGSVSGGCVENDVIVRAGEVARIGSPSLVEYGISDDDAFAVGLACGGTIQVFIEPMISAVPTHGARITVIEGVGAGSSAVLDLPSGSVDGELPSSIRERVFDDARALIAAEESAAVDYEDASVFIDVFVPAPRLFIFGATDIAQALCAHAYRLGYRVVVSDARPAFVSADRFPDAEALLVGWPDALAGELSFDARSFVVVLSHDSRFEDPLWPLVLSSPARYIGAMGSRRTSEDRLRRLGEAGIVGGERIHGPVGFDIGARTAGEMAISILSEMTMARYGRSGSLHGAVRRLGRNT